MRHDGLRLPPDDLSYDAYGHSDWTTYAASGRQHAEFFSSVIRRHMPATTPLRICEWGCGPARIIRHLPTLLADLKPQLTGTDYNLRSIAWCKENIADVSFAPNKLEPPIALPAASFNCIYCLSVFTHLSEPMHSAWIAELTRLVEPGGY